jgi:formamidopyrimidine-DNA glycosylase
MIELPESTTIARQITGELKGKRIAEGSRGNAAHKFAFYNHPAEEYAALLKGRSIGEASANGPLILVSLNPDYTLLLGEGGERIVYHATAASLPKKYQLLLHFEDDSYLSLTVQGWGAALLMPNSEVSSHPYIKLNTPSPLSTAFTPEYFGSLFEQLEPGDARSLKFFMISKPGVLGVGNGCLQDILWQARLHPRKAAVRLSAPEQRALYEATRDTLRQMTELGGRDSENDLHDCPGRYKRILHSKTVGAPCPRCATPIEKAAYLGGAIYFCPICQPLN